MTDLAQHFDVSDQGSIVMLYPQTPQARKFLEEEVQAESWQYIGGGLAVEPSYVEDLIEGFLDTLEDQAQRGGQKVDRLIAIDQHGQFYYEGGNA